MKGSKIFNTIVIIISTFIIGIAFLDDFDIEFNWNPFDYARITEVDYKAVLVDEPDSSGKVIVTERLTFDIHAASHGNLFWELWRDLPEEYIDGVKVDYKVNSVKQVFDDGREPVVFTEAPKLYWDDYDYVNTGGGLGPGKWYHSVGPYNESKRQYECLLIYVDGLYRETVVFEIEYEMYNAALRYGDCSELYLSLYSESSINHLNSLQGQILVPEKNMPSVGNYYAFTYGTNAHDFPFTESSEHNPSYHTFSFALNKSQLKFKPYNQYIEFALISYGFDKHIFTQHASENTYFHDDMLAKLLQEQTKYEALPKTFKPIKAITFVLLLIVTVLTIKFTFGVDNKMNGKYIFYKPTMQMDYFREIPSALDPNFAATLAFCKHKPKDDIDDGYASVMLSLVRKGYIELDKINYSGDWDSKNVKIFIKYNPMQSEEVVNQEPLTQTEEQYFNLILRHSNEMEISLNSFQKKVSEDYEATDSFVKEIKNAILNIGISQKYFQKADYKAPKMQVGRWASTLCVIGVFVITAGNFISYRTRLDFAFGAFFILGIGLIFSAIYLNKLSKKYILLTRFGEDEYAKWRGLYNFLNSETLINERTFVELPLWENYLIYATAFGISEKVIQALKVRCPNVDSSPVLRNHYYHSRSFRSSSRAFRTATSSASYTARSGGHGGYGGGRSRWRRWWRWSLKLKYNTQIKPICLNCSK